MTAAIPKTHESIWLYGGLPEPENTEIVSMDLIVNKAQYSKLLKMVGVNKTLINELVSTWLNNRLKTWFENPNYNGDMEFFEDFITACAEVNAEEGPQ